MGEILKVGEAMNRATTHTLPNADGWEERANLISSFRHPPSPPAPPAPPPTICPELGGWE